MLKKSEMEKIEIRTDPQKLKSLVVGDKVFRSAYDYELSPEDVEQAQRQLKETEAVKTTSLRTLKEMLARDEFNYRLDEEYLLRFLRCKKFDCNEAYKMMHYLYSLSKDYPDIFTKLPSDFKKLLDSKFISFLPYRDAEGSLIFITKAVLHKPGEQSVYDIFQLFQPIADIITANPSCQINKVVGICDFKDITPRHAATAIDPRTLWFWIQTAQKAYTWRVKRIIYVNASRLVSMSLNIMRPLLKKKISDRVVVIGSDMTRLHEYLDPAILPKEYGGSLDDNEWGITEHIMDNLPYVEYEQSFRYPKKL